jgi:hypothetical protein
MKTRVSFLLSLVVLCWLPLALAQTPPVETLSLDAPGATQLPRRFRTVAFPFEPTDNPSPSRLGLDGLRISGSGQFSPAELAVMLANLPGRVAIVDLRRESHGFFGDAAVSWYAPGNQGNPGQDAAGVASAESLLLAGIDGRPDVPVVRMRKPPKPGEPVERETVAMGPGRARTEAEEAASRGVGSFRLAVPDRQRPDDAAVDRYLLFYRTVPDDVWLHFHCRAGAGRTTSFMLMTDMLRNAGVVSFEDLVVRQWLIGGVDLRDVSGKWDKAEDAKARLEFLRRFYDYARANPNGWPQLWSQWLTGARTP